MKQRPAATWASPSRACSLVQLKLEDRSVVPRDVVRHMRSTDSQCGTVIDVSIDCAVKLIGTNCIIYPVNSKDLQHIWVSTPPAPRPRRPLRLRGPLPHVQGCPSQPACCSLSGPVHTRGLTHPDVTAPTAGADPFT